jgi:PadR family transcriptional regulator PadR
MEPLTRTEEFILLSVYQLGDNAYGITIRNHIEQIMKKDFSVGAIYVPLERLENKGLLTSYTGEPTSERGGRRKRFYKITPNGMVALKEIKRLHDTFWANISDIEAPSPGLT